MGLFSEDPRDQIIADLRAQVKDLTFQLVSMVDARAAAMTMARERQKIRERSDPNAMPILPPLEKLVDPKHEPFESDAAMELAFRGKQ